MFTLERTGSGAASTLLWGTSLVHGAPKEHPLRVYSLYQVMKPNSARTAPSVHAGDSCELINCRTVGPGHS